MSDLSITLEALERARSQLSVSSYFDEDLFRREQELIFQHGPRYLAHELALPEIGDYYALPQEGDFFGRRVQADDLEIGPGEGEDQGRGSHPGPQVHNP